MADFMPWHDWRPLIEDALSAWKKSPSDANLSALRKTIKDAIETPWVKRKNGLLIEINDSGKAYSCMDQADMAVVLLRSGQAIGDQTYIDDGIACMEVNATKTADGGLRTRDDDGSWFHGQTSRDNKNLGATFNKHLHATRNFDAGAKVLEELGKQEKADNWRKLGRQGVAQLADGHYPALKHLFVGGGQAVVNSWAYYALNYESRDGRFLDSDKNGGYHLYDMRQLRKLDTIYLGLDWSRIALKPLLKTYKAKLADGGLYVNSKPAGGGDWRAVREDEAPLDDDTVRWFETKSA